jgi:hypothetical protein
MNNNYDVYMCRAQSGALGDTQKRKPWVATSPHDLASIAPTKMHSFGSPFERMPSKIEMEGMMAIFKREYCFGDKDE